MSRNSLKNVMKLIDTAKSELPPEQSFLNDLKRSIELNEDKNKRIPSKTYKPSGMQCIRSMAYQIMGVQPDENSASYILTGICNSGSDIHVRVQMAIDHMKDNGIDCEYIDVADFVKARHLPDLEIVSKQGVETKLYHKQLNMSFLCDGIIRYKNHYYILEIKTETSGKWIRRKEVDPKHYNQATAYSIAFGLSEVIFIYVNRDILDMKAFMLNVSQDMKWALIGLIEQCDNYVKQSKVPPIPDNIVPNICEYCSYKTQCRKDR